ncbi:hypothetical protein AX16_002411 [Volvariella volvacea WC 439]|nr:hypothetical protein AX16_002411 [Volvariella volvacea WC 439]
MPHRYAPLPNQRPERDAGHELDEAFGSDNDDDDHESTPLNPRQTSSPSASSQSNQPPSRLFTGISGSRSHESSRPIQAPMTPGAYDFEREYAYDRPPPGSPPGPSDRALPNDYGNTNGLLPTSPVASTAPRTSFLRRAIGTFGSVLPTHYTRVSTEAPSNRPRGGGSENDGVFANVMAKPKVAQTVRSEDGTVYVVPETTQKEAPPSYAEAQADAVPTYWETTVHAPSAAAEGGDMLIDGLPIGSWGIFFLNITISWFFQFVGFLLTYLLHTSHAAKFGSRLGLGLTLIQFGFYTRFGEDDNDNTVDQSGDASIKFRSEDAAPSPDDSLPDTITVKDLFAFVFMTMGWFIVLISLLGFIRVKRWEYSISDSRNNEPRSPDAVAYDRAVRRNLMAVFGLPMQDVARAIDEESGRPESESGVNDSTLVRDERGNIILIPGPQFLAEARLARDLRASGLI